MVSLRLVALCGVGLAAASAIPVIRQDLPQYTLVEELRIVAADSSGEKKLSRITGLTVLPDGRIVTAHGSEFLIRVYDSSGKFLRSFGRRGGAAGEFRSINTVHSIGDTLWSLDGSNRRINILTADGAPLRTIDGLFSGPSRGSPNSPPRGVSEYITPLANERMLVTHGYRRPGSGSPELKDSVAYYVMNRSRAIEAHVLTAKLHERPWISYQERNSHFGFGQMMDSRVMSLAAAGGGKFILLSDAEIFGGQPGQVRITEMRSDGTISHSVVSLPPLRVSDGYRDSTIAHMVSSATRSFPAGAQPRSVNLAELEKVVRANIYVPEFHPVAQYSMLGRDGSLWINYPYDGGQNFIVVIDGRAQMRVRAPQGAWLREVTRDAAWGGDTDSSGVTTIRRYRVVRVR